MEKINRITRPEDLRIGQLYMYRKYGELYCGFCKRIEETRVVFKDKNDFKDEVDFIEDYYPEEKLTYIAEYNARIFRKYQKLQKQHEKELEDCLKGKDRNKSKKKWYERFLRRKTK